MVLSKETSREDDRVYLVKKNLAALEAASRSSKLVESPSGIVYHFRHLSHFAGLGRPSILDPSKA